MICRPSGVGLPSTSTWTNANSEDEVVLRNPTLADTRAGAAALV
jgi:hypothetical protein